MWIGAECEALKARHIKKKIEAARKAEYRGTEIDELYGKMREVALEHRPDVLRIAGGADAEDEIEEAILDAADDLRDIRETQAAKKRYFRGKRPYRARQAIIAEVAQAPPEGSIGR